MAALLPDAKSNLTDGQVDDSLSRYVTLNRRAIFEGSPAHQNFEKNNCGRHGRFFDPAGIFVFRSSLQGKNNPQYFCCKYD